MYMHITVYIYIYICYDYVSLRMIQYLYICSYLLLALKAIHVL